MEWSTVISYGRFYKTTFLFEKLLVHREDDSFMFLLSYDRLKFKVHIFPNYTYMVGLERAPRTVFRLNFLDWQEQYENEMIECVERFIQRFMLFCRYAVNKEYIYNREREIGRYVLTKFEAHFIDWNI